MNRTPAYTDLSGLSRPQSPNSQDENGTNYESTLGQAPRAMTHHPQAFISDITQQSCLVEIGEQPSQFTPESLLTEANRAIIESRNIVGDPLNQNLNAMSKEHRETSSDWLPLRAQRAPQSNARAYLNILFLIATLSQKKNMTYNYMR